MNQKNALLSVYNKDGIVAFAQSLVSLGWNIFASGGTAKTLTDANVPVTDVAQLVGGGAILGHRVVTLSREVHAGLLATQTDTDLMELESLTIPFLHLVCCDLYPLKEAIESPNATNESVIEKTDIGGPTMLRSAAKGKRIVIADPLDRALVIHLLKEGDVPEEIRMQLAAKAEGIVANYCLQSARFHSSGNIDGQVGTLALSCKYGENAYQAPAGLYATGSRDPLALDTFRVIQGTAPSYNNLCDLDRLLQTLTHIAAGFQKNFLYIPKIAIGVKHGNACGVGVDETDPTKSLMRMIDGDPRALMGGLVITNFGLNPELVEVLLTHGMPEGKRRLLDGVIVPSVREDALSALKRKGDKCRIITNQALETEACSLLDQHPRFRYVRGGFLKQPNYTFVLQTHDVEGVDRINHEQERDFLIAWAIGSTSNSNTITLVKNQQLIGNGVGQQDRVGAAELAIKRARDAGHHVNGSVAYSDSFFPFADGPMVLADAGVSAIIATSGSVNDTHVKAACAERGMTLCLIPDALGRGFFGH